MPGAWRRVVLRSPVRWRRWWRLEGGRGGGGRVWLGPSRLAMLAGDTVERKKKWCCWCRLAMQRRCAYAWWWPDWQRRARGGRAAVLHINNNNNNCGGGCCLLLPAAAVVNGGRAGCLCRCRWRKPGWRSAGTGPALATGPRRGGRAGRDGCWCRRAGWVWVGWWVNGSSTVINGQAGQRYGCTSTGGGSGSGWSGISECSVVGATISDGAVLTGWPARWPGG